MTAAPLLAMRGVAKSFGPTVALRGVDLEVRRGEVHALVGENGAGKSTLMKVLAGVHRPDAGTIELDGAPFAPADPLAARAAGIAMIYQELTLAPHLTVADNVFLGRERSRRGWLDRAAMARRVAEVLRDLDHGDIAPGRPVAELGPAARQLVEIARALVHDARVVVMDEPTSSLGRADVERLFAAVRRLRARGVAVIYISHHLEEVLELCDRYTVLRDGATVDRGAVAGTTAEHLVERMAGAPLGAVFPPLPAAVGEPVLELDGIAGEPLPRGAGLVLRRGEILGVAGLCGAGRTELLRAVFGLAPVRAGTVRVAGCAADRGAPPRRRWRQGLGLLSEDRKLEGLAQARSVAENLTLSCPERDVRGGLLSFGRRRAAVAGWLDRLGVRARDPDQPVAELSGGNQQKVAFARLLHHDADVLLLDEPTRGIDVGSKAELYRRIAEAAAAGKAVLVVSSYLPELLGLCHTIAVMHRGVLGPARPRGDWDAHSLLLAATGAGEEGAA